MLVLYPPSPPLSRPVTVSAVRRHVARDGTVGRRETARGAPGSLPSLLAEKRAEKRAENNAVKRSCSDNIAADPRAYAQGTWEATRTTWTGTKTKTA